MELYHMIMALQTSCYDGYGCLNPLSETKIITSFKSSITKTSNKYDKYGYMHGYASHDWWRSMPPKHEYSQTNLIGN